MATAWTPLTLEEIRRRLGGRTPLVHAVDPSVVLVRAAVAMITRQANTEVEVLFIRRAPVENDPWSGDIAFPGGRVNIPQEEPRAAAEREAYEETGIDLNSVQLLGQLDDVIGGGGAVVVSGFVYALSEQVVLKTNHEVAAAGWVSLATLSRAERHSLRTFSYKGADVRLPAIRVFDDDSPPLWGLTYQFVEGFMRLVGREIPHMPWRE